MVRPRIGVLIKAKSTTAILFGVDDLLCHPANLMYPRFHAARRMASVRIGFGRLMFTKARCAWVLRLAEILE